MSANNPLVRVEPLAPSFAAVAGQWAQRLGLPQELAEAEFALQVGEAGLQLQLLEAQAPGPVRVDFVEVRRRIGVSSVGQRADDRQGSGHSARYPTAGAGRHRRARA